MRGDRFKLRPKQRLYFALEDLDLSFTRAEVAQVVLWWNQGVSIGEMADRLGRDPDEIAVLVMDLARKGGVRARAGGAWGAPHKS